jgi:hypothetical protein
LIPEDGDIDMMLFFGILGVFNFLLLSPVILVIHIFEVSRGGDGYATLSGRKRRRNDSPFVLVLK